MPAVRRTVGAPMTLLRNHSRLVPTVLVIVAVAGLEAAGAFGWAEDAVFAARMAMVPLAVGGDLGAGTLAEGVYDRLHPWPVFALVALLALAGAASPLGRRPAWLLAGVFLGGVAVEAVGLHLFARASVLLSTPALHALSLGLGLSTIAGRLDLRRWLSGMTDARDDRQSVLERIIADSSDAVVVFDETGAVIETSRRARSLFGIGPLVGRAPALAEVLPAELAATAERALRSPREDRTAACEKGEMTFRHEGGTRCIEFAVTTSQLTRPRRGFRTEEVVVGSITARDVTQARQQQARLEHLARFDTMTGAMNRSEFVARLDGWLRDAARAGEGSAVMVLNLHRFKTINATLGRRVGDEVLCALAERLGALDDRLSEVARLGGDTFAVFCRQVDAEGAEGVARFVISAAGCPFALEDATVRVGARVGIALTTPGMEPQTLLENAELALDEAGQTAGDGLHFFDDASSARQERSRQIERALWTGIDNHELYLAYQPQVRLSDLSFVGAEALVRWEHPTMGRIAPAEFVEIAESSGFIEKLGRWVLEQACCDAAEWPEPMSIAVNVSPLQFQRSDVAADVKRALDVSGLHPSRLHLEITESIFLAGSFELIEALHDIRFMGVSLALDDFGAGFSSFGYLSSLPLDKIKLDRMFMRDAARGSTNGAVVRSVTMLTAELDLELVCEGVETEEERDFLRRLGVGQAQGYLFGRPMVAREILPLLSDRRHRGVAAS